MVLHQFYGMLKANGSKDDLVDLQSVTDLFIAEIELLPLQDREMFALNVLQVLCRNLEKVPSWRTAIDNMSLLHLCLKCIKYIESIHISKRTNFLTCVYYIHRYIIRQAPLISPDLILELSYSPFHLVDTNNGSDVCKIYWNIIGDRLLHIEKLKSSKFPVLKLLPKLAEDILKVLEVDDFINFCGNILTFLVKKVYCLYRDVSGKQTILFFSKIFFSCSKSANGALADNTEEKHILNVYLTFHRCLSTVIDNTAIFKIDSIDKIIEDVFKSWLIVFKKNTDIVNIISSIHLPYFSKLLKDKLDSQNLCSLLEKITVSCERAESSNSYFLIKVYPFLSNILRVFIEYVIESEDLWKLQSSLRFDTSLIKLIKYFITKLSLSDEQLTKCDNCNIKWGLHDALRISFLVKNIMSLSYNNNKETMTNIPLYLDIVSLQYNILKKLSDSNCVNIGKYHKKLQTDVHNMAILLNKSKHYDESIKLFELYIINEQKGDCEAKNLSRAYYNMSICKLDYNLYVDALKDAYLSLLLSYPESLDTEKYMCLVVDIKSKSVKQKEADQKLDDEKEESFQSTTTLNIAEQMIRDDICVQFQAAFKVMKFSKILQHEYNMYAKMWPSVLPMAGIWKSLFDLSKGKHSHWLQEESKDVICKTLFDILMDTPHTVRKFQSKIFGDVIQNSLQKFSKNQIKSVDLRIVQATLLFLKSDYDLLQASDKYKWKVKEITQDLNHAEGFQTVEQEHDALKSAFKAIELWPNIVKNLDKVCKNNWLQSGFRIAQMFVHVFLHASRHVQALHLALMCCDVAKHIEDKEAYLKNLSIILYHSQKNQDELKSMIKIASEYCTFSLKNCVYIEVALVFLCNLAVYLAKGGSMGSAAVLLRQVQITVLNAYKKNSDINWWSALGCLWEAQSFICKEKNTGSITDILGLQKHYLCSSKSSGQGWCDRRTSSMALKYTVASIGAKCGRACRRAGAARRARAAAAPAIPPAGALLRATLYADNVDVYNLCDSQVKIENRLKPILGMGSEIQSDWRSPSKKELQLTPHQHVEPMRDAHMVMKIQTSPSNPCVSVPAFGVPSFMKHTQKCECFACVSPLCILKAFHTLSLEASTYFRAKEMEIAKNYFEGALKMLDLVDAKMSKIMQSFTNTPKLAVDIVSNLYHSEFNHIQLWHLIEACFFELATGNTKVEENLLRIHEVLEGNNIDHYDYWYSEIKNLMIAFLKLKDTSKKNIPSIVVEFENLSITSKEKDIPKTPENKLTKLPTPKYKQNIVKDEEIPKRLKQIKLNIAETEDDEENKSKTRRKVFRSSNRKKT